MALILTRGNLSGIVIRVQSLEKELLGEHSVVFARLSASYATDLSHSTES